MARYSQNLKSATLTHPLYAAFLPTWRKAMDVYEGTGGFLDEERPYLLPHPREWLDHSVPVRDAQHNIIRWEPNPSPTKPSPKLLVRRKLARYENVADAIMSTVLGALFAEAPARNFTDNATPNEAIAAWWANCDGRGTTADDFWRDAWTVAGVFGHAIVTLDKSAEDAPTQADVGSPRVARYTPLDLIDWILDENDELVAVKLLEAEPRTSFDVAATTVATKYRVRVIDRETWTLFDSSGKKLAGDTHGFGRLPVEVLYGRRRPMTPVVGKSVMGDPQLHIDLYNLVSEVRELLRNQTFAILNVPIGQEGSAQREQEQIGKQSGTGNVLFSTNPASFISPQADNVQAYHEHIDRLTRMIYRLAATPWDGDSRDAESADSRKLKRQDMQNVLVKYAGELQRSEMAVLDLVYRALYGPERAQTMREQDGARVAYPTTFEVPDLEVVADRAKALIALEPGETATKELKRRTVRAALPNLSQSMLEAIDEEIDTQTILTADEKQQQLLEQSASLMGRPQPVPAA